MNELHNKYRPAYFDEVVGHKSIIRSIRMVLKEGSCRSFLLTGPSGIGKTTIARIIAHEVKASSRNIKEIDAATNTGIDAMRAQTASLQYTAFGKTPSRVIILDEAHALSKAAWQSSLKAIEEPPPNVYWVLCSTEPEKIPATIRTRCACYTLSPVSRDDIFKLLTKVIKSEGMKVYDCLEMIAAQSDGSPRRALTYLAAIAGCSNSQEAREVLRMPDAESKEIIDLCRLLQGGGNWKQFSRILMAIQDQNAEGIRIVVVRYFNKVALSARCDKDAGRALEIIDAFSEPCNSNDGIAPILMAIGRVLFA